LKLFEVHMRDFRRILSGLAFAGLSKLLLELTASTAATLIVTWALSSLVLTPQAPQPRPPSDPARNELPLAAIPASIVFSPAVVSEPANATVPTPPPRSARPVATTPHEKPPASVRLAHSHRQASPSAPPALLADAPAPAAAPPLRLAGANGEALDSPGTAPPDPVPATTQTEHAGHLPLFDRLPNPTSLLRPIGFISAQLGQLLPKF
jgi:hypothetical protein